MRRFNWTRELSKAALYTVVVGVILVGILLLFGNVHDHGGMLLSVVFAPIRLMALLLGKQEAGMVFALAVEIATLFLVVLLVRLVWRVFAGAADN